MLNIRKSIFETNSSSMHSIVIAKNKDKSLDDYFYHDWENCPTLELTETDLEFGRGPFNFLNTFEEKLCYLIAAVNFKDNEFNQLIDTVNQILKEKNITEKTVNIIVPEIDDYDYEKHEYKEEKVPFYGDIDHQSLGVFQGFLNKYHLTHKQFLENPNIEVVIDGDEYCYLYDMVDLGIIDKNSIEIYPSMED